MAIVKPPLTDTTKHITADGKPTKDFYNWIKGALTKYITADSTDKLTNKTITDITDVLGSVTMDLTGTDATGDIYYRNSGGVLTRLPIGATSNLLSVAGGLPSWAAPPSSGLVYLGTVSASASNISDTTIIAAAGSTYRSFKLVAKNLVLTTNAEFIGLQVHSGGAFQTGNYISNAVGGVGSAGAGGTSFANTSPSYVLMTTGANAGNAANGWSGEIIVSNLQGTSAPKTWSGRGSYLSSTASTLATATLGGYWNGGNGAVDGFQIFGSTGTNNTGTFASGSVDVYGIL